MATTTEVHYGPMGQALTEAGAAKLQYERRAHLAGLQWERIKELQEARSEALRLNSINYQRWRSEWHDVDRKRGARVNLRVVSANGEMSVVAARVDALGQLWECETGEVVGITQLARVDGRMMLTLAMGVEGRNSPAVFSTTLDDYNAAVRLSIEGGIA